MTKTYNKVDDNMLEQIETVEHTTTISKEQLEAKRKATVKALEDIDTMLDVFK